MQTEDQPPERGLWNRGGAALGPAAAGEEPAPGARSAARPAGGAQGQRARPPPPGPEIFSLGFRGKIRGVLWVEEDDTRVT